MPWWPQAKKVVRWVHMVFVGVSGMIKEGVWVDAWRGCRCVDLDLGTRYLQVVLIVVTGVGEERR